MPIFRLTPILFLLLFSCREEAGKQTEKRSDTYKQEIRQAEKDFEKMAGEEGIAEAFAFFADSNAVISRGGNDSIITGKEAIRNFYSSAFYQTAKVKWAPDYIDVSDDGTMGWTYGRYVWNNTDSMGKPMELRGVFHTVWKRQKDGSWRWVWD